MFFEVSGDWQSFVDGSRLYGLFFCGSSDCQREGQYEIRLEQGEAVWASREERDAMLQALEDWHGEAE